MRGGHSGLEVKVGARYGFDAKDVEEDAPLVAAVREVAAQRSLGRSFPLAPGARRLLRWLCSHPFPGRAELLQQARRAAGRALLVRVPQRGRRRRPLLRAASAGGRRAAHRGPGLARDGSPIDVIVWVREGYLRGVEVVVRGERPVPLPDPADLQPW